MHLRKKLKEIEERLHKKMEERLAQLERKYQELEEKLAMTLESMNKMTMNFEKYEERSAEKQDQILMMVEKQIEEANSRQNAQLRAQLG
jgi:hexokinase